MVDVIDLSNLTIPAASLLGASWLLSKGNQWGIAILAAGFIWWGIDQIIKWQKMDYVRRYS